MIAKLTTQNAARERQLNAALRERSNDIATALILCMRERAPLRLQRLCNAHKLASPAGWHKGVDMWKDLLNLKASAGLRESANTHDDELDRLRREPLPDGCAAQDFSEKVTRIQRDHVPYLERPFHDDASLARFIDHSQADAQSQRRRGSPTCGEVD